MTGNNSFKTFCRAVIGLVSLVPALTLAASNGSMGATSQGTLMLAVNVEAEVQISGLQDITQNWNGQATTLYSHNFCIYSSTSGNYYSLTVTGTNNTNDFSLVNPSDPAHPVSYQVQVNDGTNGYNSVTPGVELRGLVGSGASDCNGNPNAQLKLQVAPATGQSGKYSGTINLQVTPQ